MKKCKYIHVCMRIGHIHIYTHTHIQTNLTVYKQCYFVADIKSIHSYVHFDKFLSINIFRLWLKILKTKSLYAYSDS